MAGLFLAVLDLGDPNTDEVSGKTKHHRRHGQQSEHDHQLVWNSRKKMKKKKKCAKVGQAPSKKRKHCCNGLVQDGTGLCQPPGPPPSPPPPPPCVSQTCSSHPCGSFPDGCGGTIVCGCPTDQVCVGSVCQPCIDVGDVCQPCIMVGSICQPCTVTCPSTDPPACGDDLQAAMNGGGTVYVCPGRYQTSYLLTDSVHVIGAGQGTNETSNTILDAAGTNLVLQINPTAGLVELERLRITGGNVAGSGAGIIHGGTTLRMTDCTVSGNTSMLSNGSGGIDSLPASTLNMVRCTIRDNHATAAEGSGGGIRTSGTTTLTDCLIEGNTAVNQGGGLYIASGLTILAGTTEVRGNTANRGGGILNIGALQIADTCRVTHNTAAAFGDGGGIFNDNLGSVTLDGAARVPYCGR